MLDKTSAWGETSDQGEGISSYLGDSNNKPNTVMSKGRVAAPNLPFNKVNVAILSTFMNYEEDIPARKI